MIRGYFLAIDFRGNWNFCIVILIKCARFFACARGMVMQFFKLQSEQQQLVVLWMISDAENAESCL